MKAILSIVAPIAVVAVAATTTAAAGAPDDPFFTFYAQNLRSSLFSGFLTLGSFLVAVNTFVIVNLKKEVYDHPSYREYVYGIRRTRPGSKFYGALNRLSALLFWTIVLAVFTSVSQLTIGVIFRTRWAAIVCLGSAAITIITLIVVLITIRLNLKEWFSFWEKQAKADEQKFHERSANNPSNSDT